MHENRIPAQPAILYICYIITHTILSQIRIFLGNAPKIMILAFKELGLMIGQNNPSYIDGYSRERMNSKHHGLGFEPLCDSGY